MPMPSCAAAAGMLIRPCARTSLSVATLCLSACARTRRCWRAWSHCTRGEGVERGAGDRLPSSAAGRPKCDGHRGDDGISVEWKVPDALRSLRRSSPRPRAGVHADARTGHAGGRQRRLAGRTGTRVRRGAAACAARPRPRATYRVESFPRVLGLMAASRPGDGRELRKTPVISARSAACLLLRP